MANGLLVLSGDRGLLEDLHTRLAGRFDLIAAESLEAADAMPPRAPVAAMLAHLSRDTLNGHSPRVFLERVGKLVPGAALFGLIDEQCPRDLRELAEATTLRCLPVPLDLERFCEMLEEPTPEGIDPEAYGRDLPKRAMVGRSLRAVTFTPAMFSLFDELEVAAAHDVTVLLVGESGTGKSYLARLIHELSPRRDQPFQAVACGALSPDALQRELFGEIVSGPKSEAVETPGRLASRGTLLLGEIDCLTGEQQAKLLRTIESGEYEPVGGRSPQRVQVRLIVTAQSALEERVRSGGFRGDLYYRLATLSFTVPPLRERPLDLEYLLRRFASAYRRAYGIPLERIDSETMAVLAQHTWPGNVRELEGIVQRAVLYCTGNVLTPASLPRGMRGGDNDQHMNGEASKEHEGLKEWGSLEERVMAAERQFIVECLGRHNYHRIRTARELGISRVTLYNKMKKFGMLKHETLAHFRRRTGG